MYVIQYDSKGGTPRVWKMENAWPAVLPGADWDYNSTDRRQMSFNIVCDRCIPDYAIDTRTFKEVQKSKNGINTLTNAAIAGANISTPTYKDKTSSLDYFGDQWNYDVDDQTYVNKVTGQSEK